MHDDLGHKAAPRLTHSIGCPDDRRRVMISVDDTGLRICCSNCGTTFDENGVEV